MVSCVCVRQVEPVEVPAPTVDITPTIDISIGGAESSPEVSGGKSKGESEGGSYEISSSEPIVIAPPVITLPPPPAPDIADAEGAALCHTDANYPHQCKSLLNIRCADWRDSADTWAPTKQEKFYAACMAQVMRGWVFCCACIVRNTARMAQQCITHRLLLYYSLYYSSPSATPRLQARLKHRASRRARHMLVSCSVVRVLFVGRASRRARHMLRVTVLLITLCLVVLFTCRLVFLLPSGT